MMDPRLHTAILKEIRSDSTNVVQEDEKEDVKVLDLWEGKTLHI